MSAFSRTGIPAFPRAVHMHYAFIITLMIAVPMAMLSCLLVLKGWSLMGDAVSHAVLPGVVVAYIVGIPFHRRFYRRHDLRARHRILKGEQPHQGGLGARHRPSSPACSGWDWCFYVKVQSDVHLDHILFGDMLGGFGGGYHRDGRNRACRNALLSPSCERTCWCMPSIRSARQGHRLPSASCITACFRSCR